TIAVTALLIVGIQESATVNSIIVVLKVAVVLLIAAGGAMLVDPANWHPFIPPNEGAFGTYGWSGVFRGAAVVFFAYIGFDAVSPSALEARNPQRHRPFGLLGEPALCHTLFSIVCQLLV